MKKKLFVLFVALVAVSLLASMCFAAPKKEGGYRIGFTNSYNGNSYRQTEEAQMRIVADKLIAEGWIKESK